MRIAKPLLWLSLSAGLLLFISGNIHATSTVSASAKGSPRHLSFGVLPYLNTRTLIASYRPLATFLEQELKQPVSLTTAPNLETFAQRTFANEFDLALIPPHYGRIAELDHGYVHLLSYSKYNEALLVTAGSKPLRSIDDLRGTFVAIIDRSAVLGILAAQWFADHGLMEGKDYRFIEAGNHSNALYLAASGKTRAAVIWKTILQKSPPDLQRETAAFGDVIYAAPSYSFIANKRLPEARRMEIKEALLRFEKSGTGRAFFASVAHGGYREPQAGDARLLDRILPETRRLLGVAR